jgi:hypothetical protein
MCFECRVSFALCFTGRNFRKYNFTKAKLWVFIGWGGKSIGKIIVFLRFGEKSIKKVMCLFRATPPTDAQLYPQLSLRKIAFSEITTCKNQCKADSPFKNTLLF